MSLALITQPAFLRHHFWFTRKGLLGQWPKKTAKKTASETVSTKLPEIEMVDPVSAPPQVWPSLPQEIKVPGPQIDRSRDQVIYQAPVKNPSFPAPSFVFPTATLPKVDPEPEFVAAAPPLSTQATRAVGWWRPVTKLILTLIMIVSLVVAALIIVPEVYYSVFSETASVNQVADAAKQAAQSQPTKSTQPEPYKPPQNPDLPTGTWVSIPRIGVYSEVHATDDPNQALDTGVWMVPDFGRPGDYTQPTIMAAHRYGWDWWWKTDYWKYNSFYLLTQTEPGDTVEIIYDQRKWVYEMYAAEEGELITDYDADLILYTCKFLKSPIRYFRYAKLMIPQDAQIK